MRWTGIFLYGFLAAVSGIGAGDEGPGVARYGSAAVGSGRVSPDKAVELDCDLPDNLQVRNVGGTDGAGLCVWTAIMHAARYQHVECLEELQGWMRKKTGGGWPQRVSQLLPVIAKEKGCDCPPYLQVESDDLEVLKVACKCGRMPSVTYNYSPTPGRYKGHIAHMVSLPHADDKWFAVLDNNYVGAANLQWMYPATFKGVYTGGGKGKGWAVILLDPGPPPPPFN